MRLITHNMLKCNARGVESGYPLLIEASRVESVPSEFKRELVLGLLRKINWPCLRLAATNLSLTELDHIEEIPAEPEEGFLTLVHHLIFEVQVMEGFLVCPETGRKFPIKDGIPNMLLHEDEV